MSDTTKTEIVRSAIPQISAASEALVALFRGLEVGQFATYATMTAAAGVDVLSKRNVIHTARNRVLVDDAIHIVTVYGVGAKRISSAEAADTMPAYIQRSRSAARKGAKVAKHIDILELPADKRPMFVAQATLCHLISDSTTAKSQAKLAAAASTQPTNTAVLAGKMALEALKSGE